MNNATEAMQSIWAFEGRRTRLSYFLYMLGILAATLVASFLVGMLSFLVSGLASLLFVVIFAVSIAASLLVGAQRIRDFGHTGCWVFLWFLPYVGILLMIAMCFVPPTPGDNQYGPEPKQ
jgi:uncharacterized membrane protein YhaH (DUF805 family)